MTWNSFCYREEFLFISRTNKSQNCYNYHVPLIWWFSVISKFFIFGSCSDLLEFFHHDKSYTQNQLYGASNLYVHGINVSLPANTTSIQADNATSLTAELTSCYLQCTFSRIILVFGSDNVSHSKQNKDTLFYIKLSQTFWWKFKKYMEVFDNFYKSSCMVLSLNGMRTTVHQVQFIAFFLQEISNMATFNNKY